MAIKQRVKIDWEDALSTIITKISKDLDSKLRPNSALVAPLSELTLKSFSSMRELESDDDDLITRCYKLDPKARDIVKKLIYQQLVIYDFKTQVIDTILSDYYVNYYGSPNDLTSSRKVIGLSMIKRILISKDSDYETKLAKLAQVVYQELYGLSVVDELMYMDKSEDNTKIEEVATFGPTSFWFMVSGNRLKLDKLYIPPSKLKQIAERLAKCAYRFTLNPKNNRISTDSLAGDRVSLTADTYSRYYEYNIRRAYPYTLTRDMLIRSRSTSEGLENFFDDLMLVAPRIAIAAEQAAGKSSLVRRLAERYPEGTTIGTIESSYELNLSSIPHLIVKELKITQSINPELALEDSLRFALQLMIYGEARSGIECGTTIQAAKRSSGGTMTTGHSADPVEYISSMVQLLVRDNVFTTEESALNAVIECFDFLLMPACDNIGDDATGHRYIDSVWEVPKGYIKTINEFKPRLLFKAKTIKNIQQVNVISPELSNVLNARMKGKFSEPIQRMGGYNYDKKHSWTSI